jgi:hypothetical protein
MGLGHDVSLLMPSNFAAGADLRRGPPHRVSRVPRGKLGSSFRLLSARLCAAGPKFNASLAVAAPLDLGRAEGVSAPLILKEVSATLRDPSKEEQQRALSFDPATLREFVPGIGVGAA